MLPNSNNLNLQQPPSSPTTQPSSSSSPSPPSALVVPIVAIPLLPSLPSNVPSSLPSTPSSASRALSYVDAAGRTQRVSARQQATAAAVLRRASSTPSVTGTQARIQRPKKQSSTAGKWEVDCILEEASTASGTIYRVQWKGYEPTWEPYEHVKECKALTTWQQQRQQPASTSTASSNVPQRRSHLPNECPLCPRTFPLGKGLVAHINRQHTPIPTHVITSLALHRCLHCQHFYQSLQSHHRRCTATQPAVHSYRTQPQQIPHTPLASAYASSAPLLLEHKAEKDGKEEPTAVASARVLFVSPTRATTQQHIRFPPIPELPISDFASDHVPPCSPPSPPCVHTHVHASVPMHVHVPPSPEPRQPCCVCQMEASIIDDSSATVPLPCCQHPVHLPCMIHQSQYASTCPACRTDLAHQQIHPSFSMPATVQRVSDAYAHDLTIDEINRIQQHEHQQQHGTDAATLDLINDMLHCEGLSDAPPPLLNHTLELPALATVISPVRHVMFDASSNMLQVHTHAVDSPSEVPSIHSPRDDHDTEVTFQVTLHNVSAPQAETQQSSTVPTAASLPPALPESSVPSQLPASYSILPHLWRTIPSAAAAPWITVCRDVLRSATAAEVDGDISKRDEAYAAFMLLPRKHLNRISKQRNAARKLAKHLHYTVTPKATQQQQSQRSTQSSRPQPPRDNNISLPDHDLIAVQKATRLVREGHNRRADVIKCSCELLLFYSSSVLGVFSACSWINLSAFFALSAFLHLLAFLLASKGGTAVVLCVSCAAVKHD